MSWCGMPGAGSTAWSSTSAGRSTSPPPPPAARRGRWLQEAGGCTGPVWGPWSSVTPGPDQGTLSTAAQHRRQPGTGRERRHRRPLAGVASPGGGGYILICHHFLCWSQPHHYLLISPNHPTCYITGRVKTVSTQQQVSNTRPSLNINETMDGRMMELAAGAHHL